MSGPFKWLAVWSAALVTAALLTPFIAEPRGSGGSLSMLLILIGLQAGGLAIAVYSAVLGWKRRTTPKLMARYALPPLIMIVGFLMFSPLAGLSRTLFAN